MPTPFLRTASAGILVTLTFVTTTVGADDTYPSRTVRIVVPFAAGGATSATARLVSQQLSEMWRQAVIVDNRPGGATVVGTDVVYRSAPDGYTILVTSSSFAINATMRKTAFDAVRDFAPVTTLTRSPYVLVVHPTLPVKNLKSFIALAKSRPGELDYASTGAANHLATELFALSAKVRMNHIPYKGGGPAINDLLGGHVQVHITTAVNMIPLINNGRLKGLAITGDERLSTLPKLPTFSEAGLPAFSSNNWNGALVPANTPALIIQKIASDIGKVLRSAEVSQKLDAHGNAPWASTPKQFAELIKAEIDRFAHVVKAAGIKTE